MGFEFQPTFVPVEIEGKEYQIRVGDTDCIEKTNQVVDRIKKLANDDTLPANNRMIAACKEMRELIASMIGQEACDEIFEGRGNNFLETIQLLTYLKKTMADAQSNNAVSEMLAEFGLK